jgi:hypothetical protein
VHHDNIIPVSIRVHLLASCPADGPVVYAWLYSAYTQSLTIRKESWLKVLENRVLRKIFRPKREAVKRDWRK